MRRAEQTDAEELIAEANRIFFPEGGQRDSGLDFMTLMPKLYEGTAHVGEHLIQKENGRIIAMTAVIPLPVQIGEDRFISVGIGTVGVDAQYRNQGRMKRLMGEADEAARAMGADFAVLGGKRQRYEFYGYEPASTSVDFLFTRDNARYLFGDEQAVYAFELLTTQRAETYARCLYEKRLLHAHRPKGEFHASLRTWNFTPYEIRRGDEAFGYLSLSPDHKEIQEIELEDASFLPLVLRDALVHFQTDQVLVSNLGVYEREKAQALVTCASRTKIQPRECYKIYHYGKLAQALLRLKSRYETPAEGVLSVSVEGADAFLLEVKNGEVRSESHTGESEIRLDPLRATKILFSPDACLYPEWERLPAFARQWFPLPLHLPCADEV